MRRRDRIVLGTAPVGERSVDAAQLLRHALVLGPTGAGKSFMVVALLSQFLAYHPGVRVLVLDPKGGLHDVLVETILPGLATAHRHLRPGSVVTGDVFGAYPPALDPLVPVPGAEPMQQAWSFMGMLGGLLDGIGERMRGLGANVVSATIELGGSLQDVSQALRDPGYARAMGGRLRDRRLAHYLRVLHEGGESPASIQALLARLDYLLGRRDLARLLCSGRALSADDLLDGPVTVLSTGRPPLGDLRASRFFGQLLFERVRAAIFSRSEADQARPVIVVIDEFPEVIKADPEPVAEVVALARSRGCSLWCIAQDMAQIVAVSSTLPSLLHSVVHWEVYFRPDRPQELRHLEGLLPLTGSAVDPEVPDRLVDRTAERRALYESLARLPSRYALVADREAGIARVVRTPTVPLAELERRAAALPADAREAFRRGRLGIPAAEVHAKALLLDDEAGARPSGSVTGLPGRRSRRPPLELPS